MVRAPADIRMTTLARGGRKSQPRTAVRLRALVAVTDREASRTIRRTLSALKHRVITVADGLGALTALEAFSFDVVFFGAADGTLSARQLLLAAQDANRAPFVVLLAPPGAVPECRDGCDCLTPAFSPGDVARLLDRLAAGASAD